MYEFLWCPKLRESLLLSVKSLDQQYEINVFSFIHNYLHGTLSLKALKILMNTHAIA